MSKLYIIDLSSFIFRAFYAIRPLSAPDGTPVNALYGVATMLLKLLESEQIEYVALAKDLKGPSFRFDIDPNYKANRGAPPEDLIPQFDLIKKFTELFNFPSFSQEKYEADDIIGSIVTQFKNDFDEIYIVTGDKDLMQFVDEKVFILDTMKSITYKSKDVFEKMGVHPHQIVDYLSLIGDTSDNIPGVKGIGAKGAAKLIAEYETLESILENREEIKNKRTKNALIEYYDNALLSKKLVSIVNDLDVGNSKDNFKFHFDVSSELVSFLESVGFNSLIKKLNANAKKTNSDQNENRPVKGLNLEEIQANTLHIKSEEDLENIFLPKLKLENKIAINFSNDELIKMQKLENPNSMFVTCDQKLFQFHLEKLNLNQIFNLIFTKSDVIITTFQLKSLFYFIDLTIEERRRFYDLELAENLLDQSSKITLISLATKYIADLDKFNLIENHYSIEEPLLKSYLNNLILLECIDPMIQLLKENDLLFLYREIEQMLDPILASMEKEGVNLDVDYFHTLEDSFEKQKSIIKEKIFGETKEEFNLNSPKQVGNILFEKLNLPVIKKTKTGFSTDSSVLEQLSEMDLSIVPGLILQNRELEKLSSTYIKVFPTLVNEKTKKLHTHFKQSGTSTGRLSSDNPNLQNIPIKTENGRKLRKGFLADKGCKLVAADYSQIELRLLAHFSLDKVMVESFQNDLDIHAQTASEIFDLKQSDVTSEKRGFAKAINFGLMYGQSSFGLSQMLKIRQSEARDYITSYFQKFSRVKTFLDELKEKCEKTGFSETILGRKRFIKDINSTNRQVKSMAERVAINSPIQGSAADLIKLAMIHIDFALRKNNLKTKLLLQVHDELIFNVPDEELDIVKALIVEKMENVITLNVPLKVSIAHGENWFELK